MTSTGLENLDTSIQKFNLWLKALDEKLHWQDRRKSYKTLKVTLHAIRDHLTINQSAHFSAQLPLIVRGIYYDGWVPSNVPVKERRLQQFYDHIRNNFDQAPGGQLIDPERLSRAVFEVLNEHVSVGEIEDVRGELPSAITDIWPEPVGEAGKTGQTGESGETGRPTPR